MRNFDWTSFFTRPYKVYTQIVFWVLVFFLYILLKEYPQRMTGPTLICLVLQEMLELAIPCYTQNLLVLPWFRRRRYVVGIAVYMAQLVALVMGLPYILNAIGRVFHALFGVRDLVDWRGEHIMFSVVAFTVVASFTKIGLDRLILDKERKENELRHLKAQLNPHFLFNTLNNLYGLSVAESKKLPELMLKLSGLLRYSLYDTNRDYVALEDEVDYIGNYIELERLRLNGNVDVSFVTEGSISDMYIAPLLLIVFVENAFKHFSVSPGRRGYVHVFIGVKEGRLTLKVTNPVDPAILPAPRERRNSGGLGLDNAKKRLDLLYPGQHDLAVKKERDSFQIDLQIELT